MAREVGRKGLTKLHVVRSMHERRALMADLSDAFVAMPGGFGTLEEFCEVVTWTQLGLHAKPCGILNVLGYFSPLLQMFDHAVEERFLKPENRALVLARESPADLLEHWGSGVRRTSRNGWTGKRGEIGAPLLESMRPIRVHVVPGRSTRSVAAGRRWTERLLSSSGSRMGGVAGTRNLSKI